MWNKRTIQPGAEAQSPERSRPRVPYEPPRVEVYREDDILHALGPAHTIYGGSGSGGVGP